MGTTTVEVRCSSTVCLGTEVSSFSPGQPGFMTETSSGRKRTRHHRHHQQPRPIPPRLLNHQIIQWGTTHHPRPLQVIWIVMHLVNGGIWKICYSCSWLFSLLELNMLFISGASPSSNSGGKEVKGKMHTYYQVLIDSRDCPYITHKTQTESVTFLGNHSENARNLYAVPGKTYLYYILLRLFKLPDHCLRLCRLLRSFYSFRLGLCCP